MSHRALSHSLFFFFGVAVFVGCSAEGLFDGDSNDSAPTDPGASLPPGSNGDSGGPAAKDAGKDAKSDPGIDAGPPPPEPGSACAKVDQIFERPCGACGKQSALCLADPDGGPPAVSDYGACLNELAGGCVPGTVADQACGNCGTLKATCNKYCAWQKTACSGEPVDSCPAGTTSWTTTSCPSGVKHRSCSATCQWSNLSSSCEAADYAVDVPTTVAKSATIFFPLVATTRAKRVSGSCTAGATLSTITDYVVAYVRVNNTTSAAATISAWNSAVPGGAVIGTTLAAYKNVPTTDDERKACIAGAGDYCVTTKLPCGDTKFGALTEETALSIPAGESRVIAVTTDVPYGTGVAVEGPIALTVRTDSLQ